MLLVLLSLLALLPFFIPLFFWLRHVHVDSDPMSWEDGRRSLYKKLNNGHFTVRNFLVMVLEWWNHTFAILCREQDDTLRASFSVNAFRAGIHVFCVPVLSSWQIVSDEVKVTEVSITVMVCCVRHI